jgi:cathepsin L
MQYVATAGQHLTKAIPYTAGSGQAGSCPSKLKGNPHVFVDKVNHVQPNSAAQLKAAIAGGPTSVTVDAEETVFSGYTSGVLNSAACGTTLDHAITAVGYGNDGNQDYYIVRNSWTASWGDQGYIKIAAVEGGVGICGIQ